MTSLPVLPLDRIELCTNDQARESISSISLFKTLGSKFTETVSTQVRINSRGVREIRLQHANVDVLRWLVGRISHNKHKPCLQPLLVWKLFYFCQHYLIDQYTNECVAYLIEHISVFCCVQLRKQIKEELSLSLIDTFIKKNFKEICSENNDLLSLDLDTFSTLLKDDHLNVPSELFVWKSIEWWIDYDYKRVQHLPRLLQSLRYGRMKLDKLEAVLQNKYVKSNSQITELIRQMIQDYQKVSSNATVTLDGFGLMTNTEQSTFRPRIPRNLVFFIGGWDNNVVTSKVEVYDPQTNLWLGHQFSDVAMRAYFSTELFDGKLYLIGGTDGTTVFNTVIKLDLITQSSHPCASMHYDRMYPCTVTLNGLIYAMGGHDGAQRTATCERYDPHTDRWTDISPMATIRSDASAVAYRGRIYIAGGINELTDSVERSVEMYEPSLNRWTEIEWMPVPRSTFSMVLYQNRMFVLGGYDGLERLNSVHYYDFELKCWKAAANMNTTRSTFKATVFDNRILVTNGFDGSKITNLSEVYDGDTDQWSSVQPTTLSRSGFVLVTLDDGTIVDNYSFTGGRFLSRSPGASS